MYSGTHPTPAQVGIYDNWGSTAVARVFSGGHCQRFKMRAEGIAAIQQGAPHWRPPLANTSPRPPQSQPEASAPPPTKRGKNFFHTPSSAPHPQQSPYLGQTLPILATTDQKDNAAGSAAWSGRSAYSNSSGNSILSPYSPSRPEWEQICGLFSFANEVVNISSNEYSLASDLNNNIFALNQLVLYTK